MRISVLLEIYLSIQRMKMAKQIFEKLKTKGKILDLGYYSK